MHLGKNEKNNDMDRYQSLKDSVYDIGLEEAEYVTPNMALWHVDCFELKAIKAQDSGRAFFWPFPWLLEII